MRLMFGNEEKGKRRYKFFKYGFFIMLALNIAGVYANFDYWIFKKLISQHYIFPEDLDTLYKQVLGEENVRGHFKDFDRMVMATVTERIREINQDRYTHLYRPNQFRAVRQIEREDAKGVNFEVIADDVGHLFIPNIHAHTRGFIQQNKSEIDQVSNLIIDLRGNYGGMLVDFHRIADLFVDKGASIGHERTRWSIFSNHVKSRGEAYFNFNQIIILQDEFTASAAESLILALQENVPNVTTVGVTTFGKGVGQVSIPLTGGSAIRATVLLVEGPDGQSIHKTGIEPDIFYDGDDIIAHVLELWSL